MQAGDSYVVGSNCEETSISARLKYILSLDVATFDEDTHTVEFKLTAPAAANLRVGGHVYSEGDKTIEITDGEVVK